MAVSLLLKSVKVWRHGGVAGTFAVLW